MSPEEKKEVIALVAETINQQKPHKNWFQGLNWAYKLVLSLSAFVVACSALGTGISYVTDFINHEEIQKQQYYYRKVDKISRKDSIHILHFQNLKNMVDTLDLSTRKGADMYAVGYRGEKLPNGEVIRYYRDWDGRLYQIYPDPHYSTSNFTYWFYNKSDGTKEYTFGK